MALDQLNHRHHPEALLCLSGNFMVDPLRPAGILLRSDLIRITLLGERRLADSQIAGTRDRNRMSRKGKSHFQVRIELPGVLFKIPVKAGSNSRFVTRLLVSTDFVQIQGNTSAALVQNRRVECYAHRLLYVLLPSVLQGTSNDLYS